MVDNWTLLKELNVLLRVRDRKDEGVFINHLEDSFLKYTKSQHTLEISYTIICLVNAVKFLPKNHMSFVECLTHGIGASKILGLSPRIVTSKEDK